MLRSSRAGGCAGSSVSRGAGSLLIRNETEATISSSFVTGCSDSAVTAKRDASPWKKMLPVSSSSPFSPLWGWARAQERNGASMFGFDRPTARFFSSKAPESPSSPSDPSTASDPLSSSAPSSSPSPSPSSAPELGPETKTEAETETKSETEAGAGEAGTEGKEKGGKTSESRRLMNKPFVRRNRRRLKKIKKWSWNSYYKSAMFLGLLLGIAVLMIKSPRKQEHLTLEVLRSELAEGKIKSIYILLDNTAKVTYVDPETPGAIIEIVSEEGFYKSLRQLEKELGIDLEHQVPVTFPSHPPGGLLLFLVPLFLFLLLFKATKTAVPSVKPAKSNVTFKDVAGLREAKEEIMEFVDILTNPQAFEAMGAKCPKGLLLSGPPGTGKTLLAKAVAGEAEVSFLPANGSEFMEMFVGVGPARVRQLFRTARDMAPCIVWIDEIDSIGGERNYSNNRERDQTLNQLLVELDGFHGREGVVVMASTNRIETLDPALLRAGRFDRHIEIGLPDLPERKEILTVHMKKLALEKPIEEVVTWVAPLTSRLSGADLANLCNEAAIHAVRRNADAVGIQDFTSAIDRVLGGIERKKALLPEEKERLAYYEAGRVIAGWFLEHCPSILKVSITARGEKSGYAQRADREKFIVTEEELMDEICAALGGRAAEELRFGDPSSGSQTDLAKVTRLAYLQFSHWGFSRKIGPIGLRRIQEESRLRTWSEETAESLDLEARAYVQKCFERTRDLLSEKRDLLDALAKRLLEKETLEFEDILEVLGPRPFPTDDPTLEDRKSVV